MHKKHRKWKIYPHFLAQIRIFFYLCENNTIMLKDIENGVPFEVTKSAFAIHLEFDPALNSGERVTLSQCSVGADGAFEPFYDTTYVQDVLDVNVIGSIPGQYIRVDAPRDPVTAKVLEEG